MPKHKYYSEDSENRKRYFEEQFFSLAKNLAKNQNISFDNLLSSIRDFESFKEILKIVWEQDGSLSAYYSGMGESELDEFFNRHSIQNLIDERLPNKKRVPDVVIQVSKKTRKLFSGKLKIKKTGKTSRVLGKKSFITIKNKKRAIFRDSKGRFVSVK